jgi:hypothetical protein
MSASAFGYQEDVFVENERNLGGQNQKLGPTPGSGRFGLAPSYRPGCPHMFIDRAHQSRPIRRVEVTMTTVSAC